MQFSTLLTSALAISFAAAAPASADGSNSYTIKVINHCAFDVWPALGNDVNSPVDIAYADSGFQLWPGADKTITIPNLVNAARLFGRTGCDANGRNCAVGDCGSDKCLKNTGVPGVTLAEFSWSAMRLIFYNISLISGYNLPMQIKTVGGDACKTYTCTSKDCSDDMAYQPWSSKNPCIGCDLAQNYEVIFCPKA
ncbi:thaumatin [Protomyces lactucae-debilis]|uniref:Thaumatin n=1 Tax=Protomyces lactucae-debilis TaxID=2754530 RepID=A0A1Y2FZ33_PROLT|nr:thaumatin [Protomyces lactucae-debilis]ORY87915.1 thaumatin [Protomyces lactucae-debilis]